MISVLLHNIRSAYNVGSIFRTADASGVFSLYLSGYTPLPKDRFGKVNEKIAKTALGAENSVSWERVSLSSFLKSARAGGWSVVGVEQDARAVDYRKYKAKKKTLLVFGNEVRGLSKSLRDECDALIEIPMRGAMVRHADHPRHSGRGKESLNVSVAVGIILFHACGR